MSRIVQSPVKRWPGTVTLAEPLTYPAYLAWKGAALAAAELRDDLARFQAALLPGLCACVEKWALEGLGQLTPETFPATPRRSSDQLLAWLVGEINAEITEADDVPNG